LPPKEVSDAEPIRRAALVFLIGRVADTGNPVYPNRRLAVFGGFKSGIGSLLAVMLSIMIIRFPLHSILERTIQ
jgi:hypothetical protein